MLNFKRKCTVVASTEMELEAGKESLSFHIYKINKTMTLTMKPI